MSRGYDTFRSVNVTIFFHHTIKSGEKVPSHPIFALGSSDFCVTLYVKFRLNKTPVCGFKHFNFVAKRFYVTVTCSWGKSGVVMKLIYWAILRYKNCYVCVVRGKGAGGGDGGW